MLVRITEDSHDVKIFVAYATDNNFMKKAIYKNPYLYLHQEAEKLLQNAIKIASEADLTLKLFDGFRPQEAQQYLWDVCPDPRFVTPPEKGSPHSRGVAIDLTLLDLQGNELDMGTGFDDCRPLSFHSNTEIPEQAQENRSLLLGIMTEAGWDFYENEWWHYQLFDAKSYPLISDQDYQTKIMS